MRAETASGLPVAETLALDPGRPVQAGTEPRTIEAGLAAASGSAVFAGLEPTAQAFEEATPPEAGLQQLPETSKPADAVRLPVLTEPQPLAPELAAVSSSEARTQRVRAGETLPLAGTAELALAIRQPASSIASPDAEPLAGPGQADPAGMPSAVRAEAFGSPQLALALPLPVSTAAAGCELPVRVGELRASQAEAPGAGISLDSGSRMQVPDWTVEADIAAGYFEAEPDVLAPVVEGGMEYVHETASGEIGRAHV